MSQKRKLFALIDAHLEAEWTLLIRSADAAQEAATHSENKPENKYDTRGLEASYMAGAQRGRAGMIEVMRAQLSQLEVKTFRDDDPIAAQALVQLETDGVSGLYLLTNFGAGYDLQLEGQAVRSIGLQSALGIALLGRYCGEEIEVKTPQGIKAYFIRAVT